jgi:CheY-like chemotaxis protein
MISNYLKKADQYLKDENFDAAESELRAALKEEPGNVYVQAYKDRIENARRLYVERKKREEAQREEDEKYRLLNEKRLVQKDILQKDRASAREGLRTGTTAKKISPELAQYEQLLRKAWTDGVPDEKKNSILFKAREEFKISNEDHAAIEAEVKFDSYLHAVKTAWNQKKISPALNDAFVDLRRKFGITVEQHLQIEARLLWELHGKHTDATVFFIDDDLILAELMRKTLMEAGYKAIIANSPEQAIHQLKSFVPDLILCDMRFNNSQLNGMSIYEYVRKVPEFDTVPFIFLTAVKDDQLLRAGLGSGVDEYMTKPFDPDTLFAAIEGKLKRYGELRKAKLH